MSCAGVADALLEHALGEPATPELESHLGGCQACRAALERERQLAGAVDAELRAAVDVAPGPSFLPRVRAAVEARPSRRAWTLLRLLPVAAALAIAIVSLRGRGDRHDTFAPTAAPARSTIAEAPHPIPERLAPPAKLAASTTAAPRVTPAGLGEPRRGEPEVLVPAGEAALLARYVAALKTRAVPESSIVASRASELTIPLLEPIPALELKPLADADPEGVER